MSHLKELFCCLVVLCVSVLPVLPQNCDQFTIQPAVGPNMPLVIPEGGGATLTCTHVFRPRFSLSWFRETTAIRQDTADTIDECSCQVPNVPPGSSSDRELIFMDFAGEFAGEYSCRAPIDPSTSTFDICRFNVLAAEAPSIQEPIPEQNHTVQRGETLTIPVIVDGVPSPIITWRNDSTELVDGSGRVGISDTGALTVSGVTQYDRGNYSLSLSNIGGNLTRYFSVFVPFVETPRILDPQVSGDEIRVTCVAVGYPTPSIEWQDSSGHTIDSNEFAMTVLTPGVYEMTLSVTIAVSRFNCLGVYSCSATNIIQGSKVTLREERNFCREVIPKRGLRFNVTSCLIYTSVGEGILYSIELDMSFKPVKSSGIMIYSSQHKNGSGSYLLVQLKDGRIEFSFATSLSNVITMRSSSVITLNEWHFVAVEYSSLNGVALLSINNSRSVSQEIWTHGEPILLQSGQIFIGKIPSDQVDHPPSMAISAGFVGCIEQISMRRSGKLQITGTQEMRSISTCYEDY